MSQKPENQSYPYKTARIVDSITITQGEGIYQALERTLSKRLAHKYKRETIHLAVNEKKELQILKADICQKMKKSGNTNCIVHPDEVIPITYSKQSHIVDRELGTWTEHKDANGVWEGYLKDGEWKGVVRYIDHKTGKKIYVYKDTLGEYVSI